MPQPFCTTRRVEFRDTDAAGIMHFSAYFTYMEEAEHELLRGLGLSVKMEDPEGPLSWPRVAVSCEYEQALKFEDQFQIAVRLARLGEKSAAYDFVFSRDGQTVARGRIVAVCCRLSADEPPRAIAIPAAIADKLRALVGV